MIPKRLTVIPDVDNFNIKRVSVSHVKVTKYRPNLYTLWSEILYHNLRSLIW